MKRLLLLVAITFFILSCTTTNLPQEPGLPGSSTPIGDVVDVYVDVPEGNEWASPAVDIFMNNAPIVALAEAVGFEPGAREQELTLGVHMESGFIYRTAAYLDQNDKKWRPLRLDGDNGQGKWFYEDAGVQFTVPRDQIALNDENFLIVYGCKIGQGGTYNCGCREERGVFEAVPLPEPESQPGEPEPVEESSNDITGASIAVPPPVPVAGEIIRQPTSYVCSNPDTADFKWFLVPYYVTELPHEPELPNPNPACVDSDGDDIFTAGYLTLRERDTMRSNSEVNVLSADKVSFLVDELGMTEPLILGVGEEGRVGFYTVTVVEINFLGPGNRDNEVTIEIVRLHDICVADMFENIVRSEDEYDQIKNVLLEGTCLRGGNDFDLREVECKYGCSRGACLEEGIELPVERDTFKVGSNGNVLELYESLGFSRSEITEKQFSPLRSGVVSNALGTTSYEQVLLLNGGSVVFEEDTDTDIVADYLKFENNDALFHYIVDFEDSFNSEITDSSGSYSTDGTFLYDYEDEVLELFGKSWDVLTARRTSSISEGVKLTLLAGDITDTLAEGEVKTYTIDDKEYEVENAIVTDSGTIYTQMKINGVLTRKLQEDQTEILPDGTVLGIKDVLPNEAGDVTGDLVRFTLAAEKLFLQDTDITNQGPDNSKVELNDVAVNDADIIISGGMSEFSPVVPEEPFVRTATQRLLNEGAISTFEELGGEWEIENVIVSDSPVPLVKFRVNGEEVRPLQQGQVAMLSSGYAIMAVEVNTGTAGDTAGDYVLYAIGNLRDLIPPRSAFLMHLEQLYLRVDSDDEIWVPRGGELTENPEIDEDTAYLMYALGLDFAYEGLSEERSTQVRILPSGNVHYDLEFAADDGTAKIPLAYAQGDIVVFGTVNNKLVIHPEQTPIMPGDYFVLTPPSDETLAFQYKGVEDEHVIWKSVGDSDTDALRIDNGIISVTDGLEFSVNGQDGLVLESAGPFMFDRINAGGGARIHLQSSKDNLFAIESVSITVDGEQYVNGPHGYENQGEVGIPPAPITAVDERTFVFSRLESQNRIQMLPGESVYHTTDYDIDVHVGMNTYGSLFELVTVPGEAEELSVYIPAYQLLPQVYITNGRQQSGGGKEPACEDTDGGLEYFKKGGISVGGEHYGADLCAIGDITLARVQQIFKDATPLVVGDTAAPSDIIAATDLANAWGNPQGQFPRRLFQSTLASQISTLDQNMIVIGSPRVNAVASELLGNPTSEEIAEIFDEGTAQVLLFKNGGFNQLLITGPTDIDVSRATAGVAKGLLNGLTTKGVIMNTINPNAVVELPADEALDDDLEFVKSCSGSNCYVEETYCGPASVFERCENGCARGACQEPSIGVVGYTLISENEYRDCDDLSTMNDVKDLGMQGTICSSSKRIEYRKDGTNEGVFVGLVSIEEGYNLYIDVIRALTKPVVVNDEILFRFEPHEISWLTSPRYDMVFTQEFTFDEQVQGDGSSSTSFRYGTATGDNLVTKVYLDEYPIDRSAMGNAVCYDSDDGKDALTSGYLVALYGNENLVELPDSCMIVTGDINGDFSATNAEECTGANCYVEEGYTAEIDGACHAQFENIKCDHGCVEGACLAAEQVGPGAPGGPGSGSGNTDTGGASDGGTGSGDAGSGGEETIAPPPFG